MLAMGAHDYFHSSVRLDAAFVPRISRQALSEYFDAFNNSKSLQAVMLATGLAVW